MPKNSAGKTKARTNRAVRARANDKHRGRKREMAKIAIKVK